MNIKVIEDRLLKPFTEEEVLERPLAEKREVLFCSCGRSVVVPLEYITDKTEMVLQASIDRFNSALRDMQLYMLNNTVQKEEHVGLEFKHLITNSAKGLDLNIKHYENKGFTYMGSFKASVVHPKALENDFIHFFVKYHEATTSNGEVTPCSTM